MCFTGQLAIQWWLRRGRADAESGEGQKGSLVALAARFSEVILPQCCGAAPVPAASVQRAPDAIDLIIDQNRIGLDSLFFPSD